MMRYVTPCYPLGEQDRGSREGRGGSTMLSHQLLCSHCACRRHGPRRDCRDGGHLWGGRVSTGGGQSVDRVSRLGGKCSQVSGAGRAEE
eukprot:562514-Pyramimonas_sp.AAC.1